MYMEHARSHTLTQTLTHTHMHTLTHTHTHMHTHTHTHTHTLSTTTTTILLLFCEKNPKKSQTLSPLQTLSHCELITDEGIRHIGTSPSSSESLTVLELDNCPLVTDASLDYLLNCSALQRIELYDCQLITRAGIRRLRVRRMMMTMIAIVTIIMMVVLLITMIVIVKMLLLHMIEIAVATSAILILIIMIKMVMILAVKGAALLLLLLLLFVFLLVCLQSTDCAANCDQHASWTCNSAEGWLVGCLTSQQQASVSEERNCWDNFTCCHTEIEVADQTFYLTQSQYTDTRPTSPSTDLRTPGVWQGSHWSANV